jgi:hypothetical protein
VKCPAAQKEKPQTGAAGNFFGRSAIEHFVGERAGVLIFVIVIWS